MLVYKLSQQKQSNQGLGVTGIPQPPACFRPSGSQQGGALKLRTCNSSGDQNGSRMDPILVSLARMDSILVSLARMDSILARMGFTCFTVIWFHSGSGPMV